MIERQRAGGLSVQAFCRREGLATSTFFNWVRRFRAEEGSANATPGQHDAPAFVELTAETASRPTTPALPADESPPLEVVLPGGLAVRVRERFDPGTLRALIEALS